MYLTLFLLPAFSWILTGLFGRKLGIQGTHLIGLTIITLASILTLVTSYEVLICNTPVYVDLGTWVSSEYINVNWSLQFDELTISMLLAVILVSTIVHYYTVDYISGDPHNQRFFSYLGMFTFFMVVLVCGDNYLMLFLGWEGIGVASYLLINFWYTRVAANKGAIQAITVNRVGDIFLTIGLFVLFAIAGNLDFSSLFGISPIISQAALTLVGLLFLAAAIGKSAQIGLHVWLPTAIEGPTPVSALIHAATLVTAGVYLLIRSSPVLEFAPTALMCITWVGALTALFAGLTGIAQNDLKRIIAFSTCSQIGYLFIAVGLSQYSAALFHLVSHAFFKALLFLAAGGVLHAVSDIQDIRRLGGLGPLLPLTYTSILIGSLSLIAIPWLSGFMSKDLILELSYGTYEIKGILVYVIGTISASLTGYYSYRLIMYTFFNSANASKITYTSIHETSSIFVLLPYSVLGILSIYFGYIMSDLFVGIGSDSLGNSLFTLPKSIHLVEAHFGLPIMYKNLPFVITLIGAILAVVVSNTKMPRFYIINELYLFFNSKWLLDILYSNLILFGLNLGIYISKHLDRGMIEYIGPFGLSNTVINLSKSITAPTSTNIPTSALYLLIGVLVLIFVSITTIENSRIILLGLIAIALILQYNKK